MKLGRLMACLHYLNQHITFGNCTKSPNTCTKKDEYENLWVVIARLVYSSLICIYVCITILYRLVSPPVYFHCARGLLYNILQWAYMSVFSPSTPSRRDRIKGLFRQPTNTHTHTNHFNAHSSIPFQAQSLTLAPFVAITWQNLAKPSEGSHTSDATLPKISTFGGSTGKHAPEHVTNSARCYGVTGASPSKGSIDI